MKGSDPLVIATWLLLAVTAINVFLIYGQMRAAARQVESANLPYLVPSFRQERDETAFRLENPSAVPAYDLDVVLVGIYRKDEFGMEAFMDRFGAAPGPAFRVTPSADGSFGVRDRLVYPLVPGRRGVEARTAFPVAPANVTLLLQYRGPLGLNYSQLFRFSSDRDGVFRTEVVDPATPRKCVRVGGVDFKPPRGRRLPGHLTASPVRFREVIASSIPSGLLRAPTFADERGRWFGLD